LCLNEIRLLICFPIAIIGKFLLTLARSRLHIRVSSTNRRKSEQVSSKNNYIVVGNRKPATHLVSIVQILDVVRTSECAVRSEPGRVH